MYPLLPSQTKILLLNEIDSIKNNRENVILFCDGKSFHLGNGEYNKSNKISVPKDIIDKSKSCIVAHTHGIYTSEASHEDKLPTDIPKQIKGYCVGGIDGISCYDRNNVKISKTRWDSINTDMIKKKTIEGDMIVCDKLYEEYFCSVINDDTYKDIVIIKRISVNNSKIDINGNKHDIVLTSKISSKLNCIVTDDFHDLSCYS